MRQSLEFTIVIPTYNRLDFLQQAVNSIWTQTYCDYEIIIVDDGSTDGTGEYLATLGDRVKALQQPNKGAGAARNLGIKNAIGNYIAFLDSDDVWFPWTLATFKEAIHRHQRASLISGATVEFQNSVPNIEQEEFWAECFNDYFQTADNPAYVGSNALVVKKSIFDQVHGFDESMAVGEDFDFYFRAGACREFVRVCSPVTLGYRRHPGNISTALGPLYSAAIELLTREKNGRYPGGKARQKARWKLLARTIRPVALSCLKGGFVREAWRLYRQAFVMNARLARFRFLTGFVFYWVIGLRLGSRNHPSGKKLGADKK
jgi:glycosyltransferase involved in cell wall biosynthesis